jgi:hypothetical protein
MVVGLWSSAALAAGSRPAASAAADDRVVLLPEEDGPYELVRGEDEAWDEEGPWDEDFEADETDEEDAEEDAYEGADEDEAVIGDGVQHGRPVRGRGRTSVSSRAPTGSQPRVVPVPAGGAGPEVALPTATVPTSGPPAATVLGTYLERPTSMAVPPADLLAAPAGHTTGSSSRSATSQGPAGWIPVAALLALGVLGAGGALLHRPRA